MFVNVFFRTHIWHGAWRENLRSPTSTSSTASNSFPGLKNSSVWDAVLIRLRLEPTQWLDWHPNRIWANTPPCINWALNRLVSNTHLDHHPDCRASQWSENADFEHFATRLFQWQVTHKLTGQKKTPRNPTNPFEPHVFSFSDTERSRSGHHLKDLQLQVPQTSAHTSRMLCSKPLLH